MKLAGAQHYVNIFGDRNHPKVPPISVKGPKTSIPRKHQTYINYIENKRVMVCDIFAYTLTAKVKLKIHVCVNLSYFMLYLLVFESCL